LILILNTRLILIPMLNPIPVHVSIPLRDTSVLGIRFEQGIRIVLVERLEPD